MYSTYEDYRKNGGTLDESEYMNLAQKAASEIDFRTFGRAAKFKNEMSNNFSLCECALIDVLSSFSVIPTGISAESNDGVSVSYSQNVKSEEKLKKEEIFNLYLTSPVNLLYGGVMQCDFE